MQKKKTEILKILIIRNNPKNLGKSNLDILEKTFLKQFDGENVEMVFKDLYRDKNFYPIDKDFRSYAKKGPKDSEPAILKLRYKSKIKIAEEFRWADKILIVSPYWTGLFPSRLKDWMDLLPLENVTIFTSSDGRSQKGKDTGKEVLMLQTCGDYMERNKIGNLGKELVKNVMNYYGVKKFNHCIFERSYFQNPVTNKDKINELLNIAKKWKEEIK